MNEDELRKMQPQKSVNKQEIFDIDESEIHPHETPENDKLERLYKNAYFREISYKTITFLKTIMIKGSIFSLFFLIYQKFSFKEYVLFLVLEGLTFLNLILVFLLNYKKMKKKSKLSEIIEHIGIFLLLVRKKKF